MYDLVEIESENSFVVADCGGFGRDFGGDWAVAVAGGGDFCGVVLVDFGGWRIIGGFLSPEHLVFTGSFFSWSVDWAVAGDNRTGGIKRL
jgi:hypothetical protein